MKFSMVSGDVLKLECGALVVGIPAGGLTPTAEALDKASEGAVSRWIEAGDIHPCVGKVAVFRDFPGCKAERVVFVGLGKCKARDFQRVLKLGIDNAYLGKEVVLTTLEWLPDEVPEWIGRSVKESGETVNGRAWIYAGLMFGDIKDNCEEALDEAYNNGASGVSFFDGPDEEYLHKFKAYLDKRGFVVK